MKAILVSLKYFNASDINMKQTILEKNFFSIDIIILFKV